MSGPALYTIISNAFPPSVRLTGLGVSFGIGMILFSGFIPAIMYGLLHYFHSAYVPFFIALVTAIITTIGMLICPRYENDTSD